MNKVINITTHTSAHLFLWLGLGLILALTTIRAHAEGMTWEQLSPQQQETLAPVKDKWSTLPPERQERAGN